MKRKRSPSGIRRKKWLRVMLVISTVLGAVFVIATICLFYLLWQIGDHERRRAMIRYGLDPDRKIPEEKYEYLPRAEVAFDAYKEELATLLEGSVVIETIRDEVGVDELTLWHCVYGFYVVLMGTDHSFGDVVGRIESWAHEKDWEHQESQDREPAHHDSAFKEYVRFDAKYYPERIVPRSSIELIWRPSDEIDYEHGHPKFRTHYKFRFYYPYTC